MKLNITLQCADEQVPPRSITIAVQSLLSQLQQVEPADSLPDGACHMHELADADVPRACTALAALMAVLCRLCAATDHLS